MGKKQRRRQQKAGKRRKGGALMGMRSGFKNVASSVAGQDDKKSSGWVGTAVTVLLVIAAIALFLSKR